MGEVRAFPRKVEQAVADPIQRDVIAVLTDALAKARAGDLSSVAVVGLNGSGTAFVSRWAVHPVDGVTIIGLLATLQHDLMAGAN